MDLAQARIDFSIDSRSPSQPFIRSGQVRPIAVTAAKRDADYPDLPAIAEQVEGYGIEGWVGLFAPSQTPAPVIERIAQAARKTLEDPSVDKRMRDSGAIPSWLSPADVAAFMKMDHARISKVVEAANIGVN
jgi:tripartite-type tricarboxylate transporter receptor subunit TctC